MAVIELLSGWFEDLGFNIEIMPLAGQPNKANMIATLGDGPGGLVLSGHTDTVPYDEGCWQHDPFKLTEDLNHLYGLGTADMKSFFALIIDAVRGLDKKDMNAPLIVLATADEESSMAGARALVAAGYPRARHAIIGEPTGLKPIRMHKGIMMEAIRIQGKSGHSSDPAYGHSALEGMHRVMGEILRWRAELQERYHNPLFAVPVPTLNLGHIHGGDNPNRICGHCELHIDLRPLPGMVLDDLRAELQQRLQQTLGDDGLQLQIDALFPGTPAMDTAADTEIVRAIEQYSGYTADAVAFGTEAPYLNQLGMDTVVIGPGHIAQAHQPDEFIALNQLQPTIDLLKNMIQRFCLSQQ